MWPWGHLALGYLLYSLGLRAQNRLPQPLETSLVVIGTQIPDVIDKTLAWHLGFLASGRSLGHSLIIATILLGILGILIIPRRGRSPFIAFSVGYLSHPIGDLPFEAFAGNFDSAVFLVWPLLPLPPEEGPRSVIARFLAFELGPFEAFQFLLFGLALMLWYLDGAPGFQEVSGKFRSFSH